MSEQEQEDHPTAEDEKPKQTPAEFDINQYTGFPMEAWVKYQGTINDHRQRRRVSIAGQEKYKLRYNRTDDDDLPEWDEMELVYYPLTTKAWQNRQNALADIEDKTREIGSLDLQLAEIQNGIRVRALNAGKGDFKDMSKMSLEELQHNVTNLQNLGKNLKKDLQTIKNNADKYAFKIYFHKDESLFNHVRADDLEDIIGACDWKQINGPTNLSPSKNSPMPVAPGVS